MTSKVETKMKIIATTDDHRLDRIPFQVYVDDDSKIKGNQLAIDFFNFQNYLIFNT